MTRIALVVLASLMLWGCGDDNHFSVTPELKDDVPKKCLDDPCLPGCPPHDFLCEEKPDDEGC